MSMSPIVEFFSEILEPIVIWGHNVEPLDKSRDFSDLNKPQRLKVKLKENCYWTSMATDEVSSMLALASGRIVRITDKNILETTDGRTIESKNDFSIRHHPTIAKPLQNFEIQKEITRLEGALNIIHSINEEKCESIKKSMKLYRDSLVLLPYDVDTAYLLLVVAGETLATQFSNVRPTFEDFPDSKKLLRLAKKHSISDDLLDSIKELICNLQHLKLKAKFVDVFVSNLDHTFWDNPPQISSAKVKGENFGDQLEIVSWLSPQKAHWIIKSHDAPMVLANAYKRRCSFVHQGTEGPPDLENFSCDVWPPFLKQDSVPTYFWMERAVSRIIRNIILSHEGMQIKYSHRLMANDKVLPKKVVAILKSVGESLDAIEDLKGRDRDVF